MQNENYQPNKPSSTPKMLEIVEQDREAMGSLVGFFSLALSVDRRLHPENYK